MNNFADNLRCIRKQLSYSMQHVAELANVSKSLISKIESNDVQPSLDVAIRIANALGKDLLDLVGQNEPAQVIVRRQAQQLQHLSDTSDVICRLVSPQEKSAEVQLKRVDLPVGDRFTPTAAFAGRGNKYFYVLAGKVEVKIECVDYQLEHCDCLYLQPSHPFQIANLGNEQASVLLIIVYGARD